MRTRTRSGDQGGFALAMVVLLLFAIGVAGATGFQVVNNEFTLSTQNVDGQEALVIARAGLQRFLGTTVGKVGNSVSYGIGNGIATVTTRKVISRDSLTHLYYIRSEGSVADARTPLLPARRTVGIYAWHLQAPIRPRSALLLSGGAAQLYYGNVSGSDEAWAAPCFGDDTGVDGVGTAGSFAIVDKYPGTVVVDKGHTAIDTKYPDFGAVYDTAGIRWDILSDPSFPVDFEGMPDTSVFRGLPADSYPIVRISGDYSRNWNPDTLNGKGVLIVPGALSLRGNFNWDGIILAGSFLVAEGDASHYPNVTGLLIGGLNSSNPASTLTYGSFSYNSCTFLKANKSLSFLKVVDNTLFEINGQ